MNKKENKEYTTIQIKKSINQFIRVVCKEHGLNASTITENFWLGYISASVTGSVTT